MMKILYLGHFSIPESAAGMRVFRIAKILKECGAIVTFGCFEKNSNGLKYINFDGFNYYYKPQYVGLKKILGILDLHTDIIKYLFAKRLLAEIKPDVVILYNPTSFISYYLLHLCKKNGISIAVDATEWYEISHAKNNDKVVARSVDYRIRKLDKKMDAIISISPFLTQYYKRFHTNVYEIPPIMFQILEESNDRYKYDDGARLNIVYAGTPGKKDKLDGIIDAVESINIKEVLIHLDVIGVSHGEYFGDRRTGVCGVKMYGKLPHDQTVDIIKRADFSVLFRDNLRYAKAGFSTKFAESLSLGVPVICNSVGGCDQLIVNYENGILTENDDVITIKKTLEVLLSISDETINYMKRNALHTAKQRFSISANKESILMMLKNLKEKGKRV